jgi:hypothetical protein
LIGADRYLVRRVMLYLPERRVCHTIEAVPKAVRKISLPVFGSTDEAARDISCSQFRFTE